MGKQLFARVEWNGVGWNAQLVSYLEDLLCFAHKLIYYEESITLRASFLLRYYQVT